MDKMDPRERRKKYYKKREEPVDWKRILQWMYFFIVHFFALVGILTMIAWAFGKVSTDLIPRKKKVVTTPPPITEELLTVNEFSRPQIALTNVNGVVIHYTSNPGTSAEQNRSYFESLKDSGYTYASAHYVIGLDGEIIRCIPDNEIAYASNERNADTLAIECCHADETGQFSKATYDSLVWLVAYLMGEYDLEIDQVIRHYDVSQKPCPKYYVDHPDSWEELKDDITGYIDENGEKIKVEKEED